MSNISKIKVGNTIYEIEDSVARNSGGGLTADVKQALLAVLQKVAYIDENGQTYYDALESALYPPANLVSISAVYTQSGTVYDTDSLDSLRADLVVTALYDDTSTATITSYTLSGTLAVGTSTITVSYGGKTTTFDVTVTKGVDYTENAIENVNWLTGYDYNQTTGALTQSANQICSEKFTVQDCMYQFDISGGTWRGLFTWDENDNFLGRLEVNGSNQIPNICFRSDYTYALHVYNDGNFDASLSSVTPVNNSATQTAPITIRLADYIDSIAWKSGAGELTVTSIFSEYGIAGSNILTKINNASEVIGFDNSIPFVTPKGSRMRWRITDYTDLYLTFTADDISSLEALETYITTNDPVIIFNRR